MLMKNHKFLLRSLLFTLGGALAGLVYYYVAACATGSCAITATLVGTMAYMGFLGFLVSVILFGKCPCNCKSKT